MEPRLPPGAKHRFKGPMRHYHRTGAPPDRSWDKWIDAKPGRAPGRFRRRWIIIGTVLALLALGGIIAGLIIELR